MTTPKKNSASKSAPAKQGRGLDKALNQSSSPHAVNTITEPKKTEPIPVQTPRPSGLNLADILGTKTEFKPPVTLNINRDPLLEPAPVFDDGLDEGEIAKHTTEEAAPGTEKSEVEQQKEEWEKIWTPEKSAEVLWKTIDPLQAELYSGGFRRKLGKDAYKLGKELRKEVRDGHKKQADLNANERIVLNAYEDYLDETESLPYSDYELEALITSTAAVMAKKGVAMPPEMALALALLKSNGVRLAAVRKFEP